MRDDEQLRGTETVLVVDDNEEALAAMRRTLEWYGYEVLTAATPAAARQVVSADEPSLDLLVTDIVMPDMTGPSLGRALRERVPDLKILFVSGYSSGEVEGEIVDAEHVGFLEKPMTIRELAEAVRDLLDRAGGSAG